MRYGRRRRGRSPENVREGDPGQAIEASAGLAAAEGRLIARPHVGMWSDCQV